MKLIPTILACFLLVNCHNKFSPTSTPKDPGKAEILKEYTLCGCIKAGYKQDNLLQQDVSSSIYQELSDYSITGAVARRLDSFALATAGSIQPEQLKDYGGKKAILFHCMQMYRSSRLDSLISSVLKEK